MGWFGKSSSNDTKARIEELKKKIQAEQTAYAQPASQQAPMQLPAEPAPVAPPAAQPMQAQPQPVPVQPAAHETHHRAPRAPVLDTTIASLDESAHHTRRQPRQESHSMREMREHPLHSSSHSAHEPTAGVVLDLGEGMSLNLPIRNRMQLDDFLHIAERVRELQRLERT